LFFHPRCDEFANNAKQILNLGRCIFFAAALFMIGLLVGCLSHIIAPLPLKLGRCPTRKNHHHYPIFSRQVSDPSSWTRRRHSIITRGLATKNASCLAGKSLFKRLIVVTISRVMIRPHKFIISWRHYYYSNWRIASSGMNATLFSSFLQNDKRLDRTVAVFIKHTAMCIGHDPHANAFRIDDYLFPFSPQQKATGRHRHDLTWNYELDWNSIIRHVIICAYVFLLPATTKTIGTISSSSCCFQCFQWRAQSLRLLRVAWMASSLDAMSGSSLISTLHCMASSLNDITGGLVTPTNDTKCK
jgi:hypothetical protein